MLMRTLALSDAWTIGSFCINLAFNGVLAIFLLWVKARTAKIDDLEKRLHLSTTEQINERFAEGDRKLAERDHKLDEIIKRLERGDAEFSKQSERDHAIELKFLQAVQSLQITVLERMGDKADKSALDQLRRELRSQS